MFKYSRSHVANVLSEENEDHHSKFSPKQSFTDFLNNPLQDLNLKYDQFIQVDPEDKDKFDMDEIREIYYLSELNNYVTNFIKIEIEEKDLININFATKELSYECTLT